MTQPVSEPAALPRARPPAPGLGATLSALGALFVLALRQHARGRRVLVLAFLFLLPALLALLARYAAPEPAPAGLLEFALVFTMLPHALIPLAALLYASGMIQDEVEDQTLTYLLVRPLPRRALYLTKLLATWVLTAALTAVFAAATYAAIFWGEPDLGAALSERLPRAVAIFALGLFAYCAIFGCISLFTGRALVVGIAYVILFEGLLANIPFVVREFTVMFYLRVLSLRWLGLDPEPWAIDLAEAPGAGACALRLAGVGLVGAVAAALVFAGREFRVKTPEGS